MRPNSRRARWLRGAILNPGVWLIAGALAFVTFIHYRETVHHPAFLMRLTAELGLERHAFERVLYLAPVVWAGFLFGSKGALVTSLVALGAMLPRAVLVSLFPADALFETAAVFVVGNVVAISFEGLRRERERRFQLSALHQTASALSQSIELAQVLRSSISVVTEVMKVDAALVFLVDQEADELVFAAHQGVSERFSRGVDRLKIGEGFNGRVALTGETLLVHDASSDPSLTRVAVREEGIRSQLIVPLKSKGKVVGTLCAAVRRYRTFRKDEVELLTAIGNQIGVAVENAQLYERERQITQQLRASEERYRELFEGAHDAIWLHDLQGRIIAANRSLARLTGYSPEELRDMEATSLLSGSCADDVRGSEVALSKGEAAGFLTEATLVRKDGAERIVQLSSSPVHAGGSVIAIQHIARDVTEERRMKESLRFYLQQATRAQEEERRRIARELHDDTIQSLVVLSRQLEALASQNDGIPATHKARLEDLWQQTNSIMAGLRRLSQDLRPPTLDRLGLLAALEGLGDQVGTLSGIKVRVTKRGVERRLTPETELMLFRIAQEALRNVWRHSQASSAEVIVEFAEGKTRVTVTDNGKGFDPPQSPNDLAREGRLGLAGMMERAALLGGTLKIESQPGKGTTVTAEAPA